MLETFILIYFYNMKQAHKDKLHLFSNFRGGGGGDTP